MKKAGGPCLQACVACTAGAVLLLISLGCSIWASIEDADFTPRTAPSFLQMRLELQRPAPAVDQALQREPSEAEALNCPASLLQWYPDCRSLPVRANFNIGRVRPNKDEKQSLLLYSALDAKIPKEEQVSILGWDPVIDEVHSTCPGQVGSKVSLVHHINVYTLGPGHIDALQPGKIYSKAELTPFELDFSSFRMLASHDKLAGQYLLPKGYGIPFSDRAMLEHHILFPKCWNFDAEDQPQSSGFNLYVTSRPVTPAALVGALNFNMDVRPAQGSVKWVTRMSADRLVELVWPHAEWPEILAVHLHTHDVAHSKYFEIVWLHQAQGLGHSLLSLRDGFLFPVFRRRLQAWWKEILFDAQRVLKEFR